MTTFPSRKWSLTAGTFLVLGGLLLLRLYVHRHTVVLLAHAGPLVLTAGEPLSFADSSTAATRWRWEFGQGSQSTQQRGVFRYYRAGTYLVRLTVNDRFVRTFSVRVKPAPLPLAPLQLVGPSEGYQDEQLTFQAFGRPASKYSWRFGESGHIDAAEPTVIYAYRKPGRYVVELRTDATAPVLRRAVRIVPRFGTFSPRPVPPVDNIRWHLQRIADGRQVNRQYLYLLNEYLCGQASVPVVVGESPPRDFYAYCMNLQFDPGWTIDSVALEPPAGTGCVRKLTIIQHKSQ